MQPNAIEVIGAASVGWLTYSVQKRHGVLLALTFAYVGISLLSEYHNRRVITYALTGE